MISNVGDALCILSLLQWASNDEGLMGTADPKFITLPSKGNSFAPWIVFVWENPITLGFLYLTIFFYDAFCYKCLF